MSGKPEDEGSEDKDSSLPWTGTNSPWQQDLPPIPDTSAPQRYPGQYVFGGDSYDGGYGADATQDGHRDAERGPDETAPSAQRPASSMPDLPPLPERHAPGDAAPTHAAQTHPASAGTGCTGYDRTGHDPAGHDRTGHDQAGYHDAATRQAPGRSAPADPGSPSTTARPGAEGSSGPGSSNPGPSPRRRRRRLRVIAWSAAAVLLIAGAGITAFMLFMPPEPGYHLGASTGVESIEADVRTTPGWEANQQGTSNLQVWNSDGLSHTFSVDYGRPNDGYFADREFETGAELASFPMIEGADDGEVTEQTALEVLGLASGANGTVTELAPMTIDVALPDGGVEPVEFAVYRFDTEERSAFVALRVFNEDGTALLLHFAGNDEAGGEEPRITYQEFERFVRDRLLLTIEFTE